MDFVNLHLHTEYSLLDGAIRIDELIEYTESLGQKSVAITDHGVLYGAYDFVHKAHAAGVKPIVGMEAYLSPRSMLSKEKGVDSKPYHLLLLAKNEQGYRDLSYLTSVAHRDGFYYKPRIDKKLLSQYSDNLIATSGCMASEIPRYLEEGDYNSAEKHLMWWIDVFGDDFYIELQPNPFHKRINVELVNMANKFGVKTIATTDAHYLKPSHHEHHDTLLCLQTGGSKSTPVEDRGIVFEDNIFYVMSGKEMYNHVGDLAPDAIKNTLEIAEKVESFDISRDKYHIPEYTLPDGFSSQHSFLKHLVDIGLQWRYGADADTSKIRERVQYELGIIEEMEFSSYFLLVWDLCQYAQSQDIWWNVRGSAAGSVVCYALGITSIDPLYNDLFFERFLNPARIDMPDIDLDFGNSQRHVMINYLVHNYGSERVAAIITMGTMKAKNAFRDTARVHRYPLNIVNNVADDMVTPTSASKSLDWHLNEHESIKERYDNDAEFRRVWDEAKKLEDITRNSGVHPAGIIVTPMEIINYIPTDRITGKAKKTTDLQYRTQYDMGTCEKLGLLKIDVLGLKSLDVLQQCCAMVRERHGHNWNFDTIPYYDDGSEDAQALLPKAWELLHNGHTAGVFQLESEGMTGVIQNMKPHEYRHIVAAVALYRPGPLEYIPNYIRRMHGDEEVTYYHEKVRKALEETYGIIVYQEQVMAIASELFGYTPGEADRIRKAVGKKKEDELQKHKAVFKERAHLNNLTEEDAMNIWSDIEAFAQYAFNKAHASDYAMLSVKSAVMKAHYPEEYMCALLRVYNGDDRFSVFLDECAALGIEVKPPSVNVEDDSFTVDEHGSIRFSAKGVKHVGKDYDKIIHGRGKVGNFESLKQVANTVDLSKVNSRTLESLIKVGAFDDFEPDRVRLLAAIDGLRKYSGSIHSPKNKRALNMSDQRSIFDAFGVEDEFTLEEYVDHHMLRDFRSKMDETTYFRWEKELAGSYITGRPVDAFKHEFMSAGTVSYDSITSEDISFRSGTNVSYGGEVSRIYVHTTKNGNKMAFITVDDWHEEGRHLTVVAFPSVWEDITVEELDMVIVNGKLDDSRGEMNILANSIEVINREGVIA